MNQRQALLEQLSYLNQKTKPKDWNKLAKSYHQVNVHNAAVQEDLIALSQHKSKKKSNKATQAYKDDLNQLKIGRASCRERVKNSTKEVRGERKKRE